MGEVELTEEEFLTAYREAEAHYAAVLKAGNISRPSMAPIVTHPTMLIAVVLKKPSKQQMEQLHAAFSDDDKSFEEKEIVFKDAFIQGCLWPKEGTDHMAYLMEEAPGAVFHILPEELWRISGADRLSAKKGA